MKPLTDPAFPEQPSFDRKEQLYFEMIKYFEEGEAWHSALSSYRELANQYEYSHYDFSKLARTQRAMATIYETISKGEWQMHRYFRVIYHGLGFPSNLRDKQFIYEAEASERQSAFTDRMRQLHPAAQVSTKGEAEDEEGQYLQISSVSVYRDLDHPIYQQPKVVQIDQRLHILSKTKSLRSYLEKAFPGFGGPEPMDREDALQDKRIIPDDIAKERNHFCRYNASFTFANSCGANCAEIIRVGCAR